VMDLVLGIGITLRLGNIRSKLSVSEFPQTWVQLQSGVLFLPMQMPVIERWKWALMKNWMLETYNEAETFLEQQSKQFSLDHVSQFSLIVQGWRSLGHDLGFVLVSPSRTMVLGKAMCYLPWVRAISRHFGWWWFVGGEKLPSGSHVRVANSYFAPRGDVMPDNACIGRVRENIYQSQ
jgi:hypothetical protein